MRVGARVRVRLHGRPVGGWVVDVDVSPPPGVSLRPVTAVSGWGPPPAVLELAGWASWRWAGPRATLVAGGLSPVQRVGAPLTSRWDAHGSSEDDGPASPDAQTAAAAAAASTAGGRPTLVRLPPAADPLPLVLAVLRRVVPSPGSSLLVLVPNVGWSHRLAARLARRGVPVADGWAQAAAGWPVVVGSRSAAWSPLPRLAAALVLDAHDEGYRSAWPPYDAWEVVAERAGRGRCAVHARLPVPDGSARGRAPSHGFRHVTSRRPGGRRSASWTAGVPTRGPGCCPKSW